MSPGKYLIVFNVYKPDGSIAKRRLKGWFVVAHGRVMQSEGMAKRQIPVGPLTPALELRINHSLNNGYYEVVSDLDVRPEELEKQEEPSKLAIEGDTKQTTGTTTKKIADKIKEAQGSEVYVPEWRKPSHERKTEEVSGRGEEIRYKDHPLKDLRLDASKHMMPGWEGHNPDLVHGLMPYKPVKMMDDGTLTNGVRIAGGDPSDYRALVKPALDRDDLKSYLDERAPGPQAHRHFYNPEFTTAHREAAYQRAASFFGMGHFVPRVALMLDPSGIPHSVHQYVPGSSSWGAIQQNLSVEPHRHMMQKRPMTPEKAEFLNSHVGKSTLQKLALMNSILGNHDRHSGNIIFDANRNMHLIDHGLSFDYGNAGGNPKPHYARHLMSEPLAPDTHQWLADMDPQKLRDKLSGMGVPGDLADKAAYRLAEIKMWSEHAQKPGRPERFYHLDHALRAGRMHRFGGSKEERQALRQKIYSGEGDWDA